MQRITKFMWVCCLSVGTTFLLVKLGNEMRSPVTQRISNRTDKPIQYVSLDGSTTTGSSNTYVDHNGVPQYPKLLLYDGKKCPNDTKYIVYVYATPGKRENRDIIRAEYGHKRVQEKWSMRVIFVFGLTRQGKNRAIIPDDLLAEYHLHQDLIIGEFIDSYRNLSYKGLAAFNYITHFCPNTRFVIKTDDDVVVNIAFIMTWLGILNNNKRTIYGRIHKPYPPFICPNMPKWCVTKEDYPRKLHPPYMAGTGYIFTSDIITDLYIASLQTPIFLLEDVYFTGLLVERLGNVKIENLGESVQIFGPDKCGNPKVAFTHTLGAGSRVLKYCFQKLQNAVNNG